MTLDDVRQHSHDDEHDDREQSDNAQNNDKATRSIYFITFGPLFGVVLGLMFSMLTGTNLANSLGWGVAAGMLLGTTAYALAHLEDFRAIRKMLKHQ